jgi:hypothetical protein
MVRRISRKRVDPSRARHYRDVAASDARAAQRVLLLMSVRLFAPVFAALNRSGVRYVVVGGVATILQGYVRGTTDVDVVLDLTAPNVARAIEELEKTGYRPRVPVRAADFADAAVRDRWMQEKGMVVFSMYSDTNPVVVDLFVRTPVEFDELYRRSEVKPVEGGDIRVASLDDLIRLKRDAGRPQDLVDVAELEEIQKDRIGGSQL